MNAHLADYIRRYNERMENYVCEAILAAVNISHTELAIKTDMDRKTLRKYTKKLLESGRIRREEGLQGKYYLAPVVS